VTITITVAPIIRPFRGFADPALPDGYWGVNVGLLGDASGGLMSINIRMSASAQPSASLLWNIEQFIVDTSLNGPRDMRLDYGGFDIFPLQGSTGSVTKLMAVRLEDMGAGIGGGSTRMGSLGLPIFLGSPRKDVNVDLSLDTDNSNGANLSWFVQGFFWGPGAVNAPGGPQRPLTSLYGR